ncbi:hypothetical protein [Flavobacterium sp. GT3R68]|uniref:hypothetical protein n=1 Tax=Flavobacterium sp. GT3R68 TaxID=2594437 RepID=UPI000F8601D2|nr:hypothetical protein [Flavobacterium sp. GT3R68]RTY85534.1 hypothetical protein EKL32_28505 [Flavobacterium sp. GSN2]TRW89329.1 hypothetical protein FNW07_13570 [Flavobacterium sp. GT3R68]
MKKYLLLLLLFISFTSFSQTQDVDFPVNVKPDEKVQTVSIIQLISNPEKYDGKIISVAGFLNLGFEETALYLSQNDEEHKLKKNSIWIDKDSDRSSIYHKEYVIITGTFDMKNNGHFGSFSGTLKKITNIYKQ